MRYILVCFIFWTFLVEPAAQEVPILSYGLNDSGQVELEVASSEDKYYVLKHRYDSTSDFQSFSSLTLGQEGITIISEPLGAYPLEQYQVLEYAINSPFDSDNDGINDILEFDDIPDLAPFNAGKSLTDNDGVLSVDETNTFDDLSIQKDWIQWSEFLNGRKYVKYLITDFYEKPQVYFINTDKFNLHQDFAEAIGVDYFGDNVIKGQVIYHPDVIANNGRKGEYAFNYSNGHGNRFDIVRRTQELLAVNMPMIENNLAYFVTENSEDEYLRDSLLFAKSRVPILRESVTYSDVDYVAFNTAEGYGYFRKLDFGDLAGPKDIVLYETLPNSLPRVAGIVSTVMQTPLSHINLRAIQDGIPNAFIKDPLEVDSLAELLDHYIYYKVVDEHYVIREASLEEVNNWHDEIRPKEALIPQLNLEHKSILPLDDIYFDMSDGFGAKCANVATMGRFGFSEGTIPNGFGIPFYFYQEFMNYNGFFGDVEKLLADQDFMSDRSRRDDDLNAFRKEIRNAEMPDWMLEELDKMHKLFPDGTSVRCRSSTNNEDLPGFSGAGLYTSKTQHPDEGHISKSIKQVFASLWNLRAFEEREFYKVDHFQTAMGVLCHPNYSEEKANGVGVSADPKYNTQDNFYLNTQLGEELITNPTGDAVPEEILLGMAEEELEYILVQRSNLLPRTKVLMSESYLSEMRDYMSKIHDEFEILYKAEDNPSFAMDIEYKITKEDQLIIKQARPWPGYEPQLDTMSSDTIREDLVLFPNPSHEIIFVECKTCDVVSYKIYNLLGQEVDAQNTIVNNRNLLEIELRGLVPGSYFLQLTMLNDGKEAIKKFIKH